VWIWTVVSKNRRTLKEQRARQFDVLENFHDSTITATNIKPFKGEWIFAPGTAMGGGTAFYDIRVPMLGPVDNMTERSRAATVLGERFERLKARPEIWWSLDRAKRV
jgi:uncharacterized protein (DUF1786 family)